MACSLGSAHAMNSSMVPLKSRVGIHRAGPICGAQQLHVASIDPPAYRNRQSLIASRIRQLVFDLRYGPRIRSRASLGLLGQQSISPAASAGDAEDHGAQRAFSIVRYEVQCPFGAVVERFCAAGCNSSHQPTGGRPLMDAIRILEQSRRALLGVAIVAGIAVGVGSLTACESQQTTGRHSVKTFCRPPASLSARQTRPDRQTMVHRLPAHKFVQRVNGDVVHYVYAVLRWFAAVFTLERSKLITSTKRISCSRISRTNSK